MHFTNVEKLLEDPESHKSMRVDIIPLFKKVGDSCANVMKVMNDLVVVGCDQNGVLNVFYRSTAQFG